MTALQRAALRWHLNPDDDPDPGPGDPAPAPIPDEYPTAA